MAEDTDKNCNCDCKSGKEISIADKSFWDLWLQKILRNFASMKFQWLVILYVPVVWGMFHMQPGVIPPTPWITSAEGLTFLGGGFITLATSRIIARTRLTESNGDLDTDK